MIVDTCMHLLSCLEGSVIITIRQWTMMMLFNKNESVSHQNHYSLRPQGDADRRGKRTMPLARCWFAFPAPSHFLLPSGLITRGRPAPHLALLKSCSDVIYPSSRPSIRHFNLALFPEPRPAARFERWPFNSLLVTITSSKHASFQKGVLVNETRRVTASSYCLCETTTDNIYALLTLSLCFPVSPDQLQRVYSHPRQNNCVPAINTSAPSNP